jgi:hypothetical protein
VIEELTTPARAVASALIEPDPVEVDTLRSVHVATPSTALFEREVELERVPHVALPFFDKVTRLVELVQRALLEL